MCWRNRRSHSDAAGLLDKCHTWRIERLVKPLWRFHWMIVGMVRHEQRKHNFWMLPLHPKRARLPSLSNPPYPPITKSVTPYSVMNYSIDFASGALKVSELTLCPIKKQVFPMLTPFSVTDLPFSSSSLPDDRGRYSPLIQYRLFQRKTPVHRR